MNAIATNVDSRPTPHDSGAVRTWALRSFIVSITLSALVGIYILLSGDLGDLEGRVLLTAVSVSVLSILAMACGAAYERGRMGAIPHVGIAVSVASFLLLMAITWGEVRADWVAKLSATFALAGIACAHASLIALPELAPRFRFARRVGWLAAFGLTALLAGMLWDWFEPSGEMIWRIVGVLAILVAAATTAIPVLYRMSGAVAAHAPQPTIDASPATRFCINCGESVGASTNDVTTCPGCDARFRVRFEPPEA